jgi:dihydropteroate synthase
VKDTLFYLKKTLNFGGKLLTFEAPMIMGIMNITPDSFYEGSRIGTADSALFLAEEMITEGAGMIDVGGYSTRPEASEVSVDEELKRTIPVIEALHKKFPDTIVSIDTFRSTVATEAVQHGASMINDVSGGNLDVKMFETVAALGVPYVLMHMRGTPETMKDLNRYENLIREMGGFFSEKVNRLHSMKVNDIILDPGIGFAKNIGQNFEILRNLSYFRNFGFPLMIGVSRKSLIYRTLKIDPGEALNGTTVLNTLAILNGASILRVHDVKAAHEAITLLNKYQS